MSNKRRKNLALSLFLLITGTALLMKNLGIIPSVLPDYIFSWKTLLLLLGLVFTIIQKEKTAGIVLASVGFYFLIPDIWNINPVEAGLFWPILFMAAGFFVLLSGN